MKEEELLTYFLHHPLEWEKFRQKVEEAIASGTCVCGLPAMQQVEQYDNYWLCSRCRQKNDRIALIHPSLLKKINRLRYPVWLHLIYDDDVTGSLQRLAKNIKHKQKYEKNIEILFLLGNNVYSRSLYESVKAIAQENGACVIDAPVGMPVNFDSRFLNEETLLILLQR